MTEMGARANQTLHATESADDRAFDRSLRPTRFEDFVGQERIKDNLRVFVQAAAARGEPIDHTLFCGPPGLGKTTLALILAEERGVTLHSASGPAIEHKGQLAALLTKLDRLLMRYGVEGRVPYLDHRLVEFGLSLPDSLKVRGRRRKFLLRTWGRPRVPSRTMRMRSGS